MEQHKVFISFYHNDDQWYKDEIIRKFGVYFIDKSVSNNEYDSDNSDEYIKRLIREEKVSDSSVVVVLCGKNTKCRKHVDWEIYAGLTNKANGHSGLVGIALPEIISPQNKYNGCDLPARLYDNINSGYAKIYSWSDFSSTAERFIKIINEAFENRVNFQDRIKNDRLQMRNNTNGYI